MKKITFLITIAVSVLFACKKKSSTNDTPSPTAVHCTANNIDTTKAECSPDKNLVGRKYRSFISKATCEAFYKTVGTNSLLVPESSFEFIDASKVYCLLGVDYPVPAQYRVSNDTVYINSNQVGSIKYTLVFTENCKGKLIDPATKLKYYFVQ